MNNIVNLSDITGRGRIAPDTGAFSHLGHDYAFIHITSASAITDFLMQAVRMTGLSIMLCNAGRIELEVNASHFTLSGGDVLSVGAGSLLSVRDFDAAALDIYVLMISNEFLGDITFDINLVSSVGFNPERTPLLRLNEQEAKLMRGYFDIIHYNTTINPDAIFVRGISSSVISATLYQLLQFYHRLKGTTTPDDTETGRHNSRRNNYLSEFMRLVHQHHRSERSTAFYASRLFISPKYLSHIIKETTGRSAAEWIDQCVILEAKNLLRYSGKNVQQVAYELNFPNQSAFGKYFKHLTGMSPTEFQRK